MSKLKPRSKRPKVKAFSFRYLLLSMLLGIIGGISALAIAMSFRTIGGSINWSMLLGGLGGATGSMIASAITMQQNKRSGSEPSTPSETGNPDPLPPYNPNKPKPFTPSSFQDVREPVEVQRSAKKATRLSAKEYLELSHQDKPKEPVTQSKDKPKPVTKPKPVMPIYVPHKVIQMLNGNEQLALRLYEGIYKNCENKDERWIWEKVVADLERDRR